MRAWALVDLAEAVAGGNGNRDAARRRCTELSGQAATTGSPLLRASVAVAAPILATEDAQAAFDAFDAIGADAWAERARRELRAAGERSDQRAAKALDVLAPQELQMARVAAEGLSNREIGSISSFTYRTEPSATTSTGSSPGSASRRGWSRRPSWAARQVRCRWVAVRGGPGRLGRGRAAATA